MTRRLSIQRLYLARGRDSVPQHLPGDQCECAECSGTLKVYATRLQVIEGESWRVRYLECNACHRKPEGNKNLIPPEFC